MAPPFQLGLQLWQEFFKTAKPFNDRYEFEPQTAAC
jgi:hypothetical protein